MAYPHLWVISRTKFCLNLYIYIYILTSPHGQDMTQGQFFVVFNGFEFRVFFLLDRLPNHYTNSLLTIFPYPRGQDMTQDQFFVVFNGFEFRVFFLLVRLPNHYTNSLLSIFPYPHGQDMTQDQFFVVFKLVC